jgi:CelD/BcsL family acetyltransferase involved in cellulose biosynthesis
MTIELHLTESNEEWNSVISRIPHNTLFHTWNWLKIAEKYTHSKLYPLIATKNNIPVGLIPLFFQKKGTIRMVFSPPPHAAIPYLGPLFIGSETLVQEKWEKIYFGFQNALENFINDELYAQYSSIFLADTLQDPRAFLWSGYSIEPNYDYQVDLSKGIDYLFTTLDHKQRADIKRAKAKGMIVEPGTKTDCETILDLLDVRYIQQAKIITASKNYFLDIYDVFCKNLKIFVVKVDDKVITGSINIQHGDTLYCWVGNPKPVIPISPSPNDYLISESVRYACENGLKFYTTYGAAGDKRLHKYYAQRFSPHLGIRYNAIRKSFLSEVLEKGYTNVLKPMRGTLRTVRL